MVKIAIDRQTIQFYSIYLKHVWADFFLFSENVKKLKHEP